MVPAQWRVMPLGKITISRCDGPFGSGLKSEHYTSSGVRVIRLQNITREGFDGSDEAFVDAAYVYNELGGHDVIAGDLLIAGLGDLNNTVGRACVAPEGIEPAIVKADCFRFRLNKEQACPAFMARALSAGSESDAGTFASGSTRSRISLSLMASRRVPVPPISEQFAITKFLDREAAKIDALIAEQERLIELLQEKRQAVISHAVTKGLNPDVPMKPSGVEWLGEVPEHWTVAPLKRDLAFLTSGSRGWAEHYSDDGALFIRIGNLTRAATTLDLTDIQRVEVPAGTEGERTKVTGGDVLFSITAYLGSVAVVPDDLEPAYVSQHVALVRLQGRLLDPTWVAFTVLSDAGQNYLSAQGYGGTKVQLSLVDVANLVMTIPPIHEQQAVVQFLNSAISRFEELLAESKNMIAFLQERRSALISAAVTGQIDVRGLVEQAAA